MTPYAPYYHHELRKLIVWKTIFKIAIAQMSHLCHKLYILS
jgi:hypothetical protein